jgi:hypothetical protein
VTLGLYGTTFPWKRKVAKDERGYESVVKAASALLKIMGVM